MLAFNCSALLWLISYRYGNGLTMSLCADSGRAVAVVNVWRLLIRQQIIANVTDCAYESPAWTNRSVIAQCDKVSNNVFSQWANARTSYTRYKYDDNGNLHWHSILDDHCRINTSTPPPSPPPPPLATPRLSPPSGPRNSPLLAMFLYTQEITLVPPVYEIPCRSHTI